MKPFIEFIKKEFYHIFRDPRTLLILFAMPVMQLLLFGFVIKTEIKEANIAFWDKSRDVTTQKLQDKIISSGYFKLVETVNKESDIHDLFKKGAVKLVIIFEQNFDRQLTNTGRADVQIIADASDPNIAAMLVNYAGSIFKDFNR